MNQPVLAVIVAIFYNSADLNRFPYQMTSEDEEGRAKYIKGCPKHNTLADLRDSLVIHDNGIPKGILYGHGLRMAYKL